MRGLWVLGGVGGLTRFSGPARTAGGFALCAEAASNGKENTFMPTTHHSAAAERHLQAAHAHEAAAASHHQNDHLGAHEASRRAMEFTREAHEHSERVMKESVEVGERKEP
jgi:hypothetical protein